jgi:hypothetical protein
MGKRGVKVRFRKAKKVRTSCVVKARGPASVAVCFSNFSERRVASVHLATSCVRNTIDKIKIELICPA